MGKKKEQGLIFTKGRYELKFRGTDCLNCGHLLDISDKYCPNCGQANSTKKLVLKDFVDEFFSSLVNYDSKLLTTLYTMLLRPGTITGDYIKGKRITYTNPFRFLFSLAFIYLLLVSYGSNLSDLDDKLNLMEQIDKGTDFNFDVNEDGLKVDSLGNRVKIKDFIPIDSIQKDNPEVAVGFAKLDSLDYLISRGIKEKEQKDSLLRANPKLYVAQLQEEGDIGFNTQFDFFVNMLRQDSISTYQEAHEKYGIQKSWKGKMAFNASKSTLRVIAQPGSWLDNTMAKLPFVVFLFLPLFTIFIWVVYIRKNYTYTDHLIFSFHNQSLLFILLILSWIVDSIFGTTSVGIFLLIFGFYLYKAMRRFYSQGRFKTIIKYLFLNTVFTFLALVTVLLIFTGSVFTY